MHAGRPARIDCGNVAELWNLGIFQQDGDASATEIQSDLQSLAAATTLLLRTNRRAAAAQTNTCCAEAACSMIGNLGNPQPKKGMNKLITRNLTSPLAGLAAIVCSLIAAPHMALAQEVQPVLDTSRAIAQSTEESQARIDQLDQRTQNLLSDFRANLQQLEQLNRYNASQQRQVDAQRREMQSLEEDINNIASLQRAIQPLMEDMVEALDQLVEADIPFLMEERRNRVERLRRLMDDPARSPAQRYRLVVEAYQIENEYGRTIESYRGDIEIGGRSFENVEFLRIGRVALIMRTDDDQTLKRFDRASRQWVDLDMAMLPDVRQASRIAREQIPPDLIFVPLTAPQTGEGG